jgi:hypothetical protein
MKLSNGLKDALLAQLIVNFRAGRVAASYTGYRIRFFDSSQITTPYPLNSQVEFNSTYFQAASPAGLLLDFGFTIAMPLTAIVASGRSIKLLGTYTENARISGTADLGIIYSCENYPTLVGNQLNQIGPIRILITDSVVPNGQQGAFVLTQTVMNAGDSVSIADFTLNLIEP